MKKFRIKDEDGMEYQVEEIEKKEDVPTTDEDSIFTDEEIVCPVDAKLNFKELFLLAVATSIDALAVGITFSFYKNTNIFANVSIIGITTFVIGFAGVAIGNKFGTRFKKKAEITGGVILVLIGAKILLEGLGIL